MELKEKIVTTTRESGRLIKPATREELLHWVNLYLNLAMPRAATCPGHVSPLDYLAHAFFEEEGGDAVVWACRGGGKTMLGAVATLLDLLFKPGIQVRILGGSLEQSEKMYAYLRQLIEHRFRDLLAGEPTRQRLALVNGSVVEILTQSERSVRGMRVQKLRCDEVELFDPGVWQAAQLTTKSVQAGEGKDAPWVMGSIEALSTMHKPGGVMQKMIMDTGTEGARKHFTWCVWDVIGKCSPEHRSCDGCVLWDQCRGRAREATGFVPVEDVIAMKRRVSKATWEHEMLCHPPRLEDAVFHAFSRPTHVREFALAGVQPRAGELVMIDGRVLTVESVVAGVDFGYHVFVCLWVVMLRGESGERVVWVVDELVRRQRTLPRNAGEMKLRRVPHSGVAVTGSALEGSSAECWRPAVVYCDVAGGGMNSQTGIEDERVLRGAGFVVKSSGMRVEEGLAVMNELVDPAIEGAAMPRLLVDPRCVELIAAMEGYRRKPGGMPEKDGQHDHLVDALRYALMNHGRRVGKVEVRTY